MLHQFIINTHENPQDYGRAGTSDSFALDKAGVAARSRRRRISHPRRRRGGPPCAREWRTAGAWSPPPSALAGLKGEVNILFASILNYPAHWKEDIIKLNCWYDSFQVNMQCQNGVRFYGTKILEVQKISNNLPYLPTYYIRLQ